MRFPLLSVMVSILFQVPIDTFLPPYLRFTQFSTIYLDSSLALALATSIERRHTFCGKEKKGISVVG